MVLTGIAASPGIVIGRAIVIRSMEPTIDRLRLEESQIPIELKRLDQAMGSVHEDLDKIRLKAINSLGAAEAEIIESHQQFLSDPEFADAVRDEIREHQWNAEAAVAEVRDRLIAFFEQMDNEYMRERAADLRDLGGRLIKKLAGYEDDVEAVDGDSIILVTHDLTPSDTAQLDPNTIKGFVTEIGGRTSHSAIMARTMEIPAVVGLKNILQEIENGDLLIIDGVAGQVHVKPDAAVVSDYEAMAKRFLQEKDEARLFRNAATLTADGHRVELAANIGKPEEAVSAFSNGAEGIGLFRSEFIYMGRETLPSEDEQFHSYRAAAIAMKGKPVIIRTLDIGGDKDLPYLAMETELNPFLGHRAIRLCLSRPELFKTQLRAILRASAFGNVKIMFPMIATLGELRSAKRLLQEAEAELDSANVSFNKGIETGIMIEIPAAVMIADQLAKEVDFFSIGTNDLIQYTLAADRMNENVAYLYDPFHLSVLRMIRQVIQAAHQEGKWVGMCGEMAGEELAVPLLLGLGLDEFSMSPVSIAAIRRLISRLSYAELRHAAEHALTLESGEQIKEYAQTLLV